MKKIIFGIISVVGISMSLIGCGGEAKTGKSINGDDKFIVEASKIINKRWDEQDKGELDGYTQEQYIAILERETEALEKAKETITNKELLKSAEDYIKGNKVQIESEKTEDFDLAYQYSEESDNLRKPALITLVDKYGLKINDNNKQIYNDFKAKASVINRNNEGKKFAEKLAHEIKLESSTEYGWIKYESILENTSDLNFDSIYYNVQFKDKDGVVVDNSSIYLENFSNKSKQKVEVSTDKKHETVSIELDQFYLKE